MRLRKGSLSDPVVLAVAILVYIAAYVVFYLIYTSQGIAADNVIVSNSFDIDRQMMLRNYMQSNLDFSGEEWLVSDIFYALSSERNNTQVDELRDKTNTFFQSLDKWKLTVYEINHDDTYTSLFALRDKGPNSLSGDRFDSGIKDQDLPKLQLPRKEGRTLLVMLS
jgi:hypothetical protein